jgi:hypothetical protein
MDETPNKERRTNRDKTTRVSEVRTPQVFAHVCPHNPAHTRTRVYRTVGVKRYCVCDDCGETWSQFGPRAGSAVTE